MTRHRTIAILVLLAAGANALRAAETNVTATTPRGPARLNFESFRIIAERNIFNPNRYPGADYRVVRREPDRRARTESFALVGTMSYEKGRFAFFDGSSSDYRKVLGAAESIAGYTIAAVTPEHVTLQTTNQQEIQMPIGMQMRRIEDGDWELTARTESSFSSTGGVSSSTSTTSTTSGPGGSEDEVLKRMMQRREQEGAPQTPPALPEPAAPPAPERSAPPDSSSGGESEILSRLQQQREQELR